MTTLIVNVEDALMERIARIAAERGEDATQVVVDALEHVFKQEAANNSKTMGAEILELLTPYWAEQDTHPERYQPGLTPENAGDSVETYLAQHWANDIRKESTNRE